MRRTVPLDSPWAPLLGLLPGEIVRSLGPWLEQLAQALGPLRARARTGTGTPDGFEGLSLRGPYDRLVLSEWALADLLPEEFVRRAAQGEHAFYQLARRDEARAKTSVALFDPGPMQLGGPRLGQFAALLVLAGRARQAGATFGWATLQSPPAATDPATGLHLGLDAAGLRGFLLGRSAFAPTDSDLAAWLARARHGDWEDLWIIGPAGTLPPGRRLTGVQTPVGRIELADVFEPGVRALDVTVTRGAHRRPLRLHLPPESVCQQLLRGGIPLPPVAPPPVRLARTPGLARPVSAAVLLAEGRKAAFVDAGESVTIFTVPDVPSARRGRYQRFAVERDSLVVALGWTQHRLLIVSERRGELHVHDSHGDVFRADASVRRFADPATWQPAARPAEIARAEVLRPGTAGPPAGPPTLAFLDGQQRLIGLGPDCAEVLTTGVLAALQVLVDTPTPLRVAVARLSRVYGLPPSALATTGALARVPDGDTVLGLVAGPQPGHPLALLTLSANRRAVGWFTGRAHGALFAVDHPVRSATVAPSGDRVALVLDDGRVEVWALPRAVCLLRVEPPA